MSMELELRHLKLICAIADNGTVTKAATRLHLSQSALSHQLNDLEAGLGVSLFRRLPRRMVLTPAGEGLLAPARHVLAELRQAQQQISASPAEEKGVIRISTECYTCYHWLPAKLKEFHAAFPNVDVQIVVEATHQPIRALLRGRLDVAIVADPAPARNLSSRLLFQDELVVIVNPEHPLGSRPFARAEDFIGEHLITYSIPLDQLTLFQEVLRPARVRPARHSQVELTEAIVEMVKAGLGISVLARWAVAPQLKAASLRAVPLTKTGFFRKWSAVTLRQKHSPAYLTAFLNLLAE